MKLIRFLRARLAERSTVGDLAAAALAVAAAPWPWSGIAFALLSLKALVPDGPLGGAK